MFLFQKGQTIDNLYTVAFPHKEGAYAETYRRMLLPQWLTLPIFGHPHWGRVNHGIFGKQSLDVLKENGDFRSRECIELLKEADIVVTNKKRHEELIMYQSYTPEEYPHYVNYDAIEVGKVANIPCDYNGVMGKEFWFAKRNKQCPEITAYLGYKEFETGK